MGTPSTRTVLQKADLGVATLATGGLLNEEDAAKFIQVAIKGTTVMQNATVVPMKSPQMAIPRYRFDNRVLKPGTEATALPLADRSVPTLNEVALDAKLFKAELRLSKEVLEDNIEGQGWLNNLRNSIAEAFRRDLEHVVWNGDTASGDALLAVLDGVRKQVSTNTFAAGTNFLNKGILRDTIKALPVEFQKDRNRMWFMTSPNAENELRDSLADRATVLGDTFVSGVDQIRVQGSRVVSVPESPENLGGGTNESEMIYIDPKNIFLGFHRQIEMESDTDIAAGQLIIVISVRMDVKVTVPEAAVKTTGIQVFV